MICVLELGGHFEGIYRKIQIKPIISDDQEKEIIK